MRFPCRLFIASILLSVSSRLAHAQETNLLPNGSFEFWSRYGSERLKGMVEQGPAFDGDDPLVPTRWQWQALKSVRVKQATDAHAGKYALGVTTPEGVGANFALGYLEVVPEASYSFGVWVKGMAQVTVRVVGQAVEGGQELAKTTGKATNDWQRVGGAVTIPGHVRLVTLFVDVWGKSDVLLDDANISAPLDLPYEADALLSKKQTPDTDTVLLADFDKDDPSLRLVGKAHLVENGRFGRALRLDRPDMASLPFRFAEIPKEGTIECWLSPDQMPMLVKETWETIYHLFEIRSAAQELGWLQADTSQCLRWCWRIDDAMYPKANSVAAPSGISLQRMRKGQWTHVAITWDPSAVRLYVDGVLAAMQAEPPLNLWAAPASLHFGTEIGVYTWSGMLDELRVSKVRRYGPFTPKGATPKPLPIAQAPAAKPAPVEEKPPQVDYAAERRKLISGIPPTQPGAFETMPNPAGDYIYEATSAKPLVNDAAFQVEQDKILPGLTTAWVGKQAFLIGDQWNEGLYWKMGNLKPGRYWAGVLYESNRGELEAPQAHYGHFAVYLNGRIIQLSSTSDPVQIAPGVWFAEAQAASAEFLKP
ncbi:MAG: LamG domain-containing protein, partial [Armatimonadetes bacterium]|nr:LamG domain-containing protein [Armatimonadota bacterium]